MYRRFSLILFGLLLATVFGIVAALLSLSPGTAAAAGTQAVSCDTSGTTNGGATPRYGTVGTTIVFTGTGFTGGESVSFWFTSPQGDVIGTAAPIPGGVHSDGSVGPLPLTISQDLVTVGEGRWALTFEGASSHHQAIIYFCVFTAADATAISQPTAAPTNTSAPPTNTAVAVATDTPVAVATDTPATVATDTPAAVATTVPTEVATATTVATAVPIATEVPPTVAVAPTSTTEIAPFPTSVVPGMPTTGNSDGMLTTMLALLALATGLLVVGWLVLRLSASRR